MFKTQMKKQNETVHEWYVVDVDGKVLGRAATKIATLLKGKHKADFTPNVDNGSGVIVLNCGRIRVTGNKAQQKVYKSYSGYPSGQKEVVYKEMAAKNPIYVLRHAVKGMLPKSKLGAKMLKRLKVYKGAEHPHTAQIPKQIEV